MEIPTYERSVFAIKKGSSGENIIPLLGTVRTQPAVVKNQKLGKCHQGLELAAIEVSAFHLERILGFSDSGIR